MSLSDIFKGAKEKVDKAKKSVADWFAPVPDKVRVRDFVRELPEAEKKVAKAIGNFAVDVLRAPGRAAASATLSATGQDEIVPTTMAEKFLWGDKPIKNIPLMGKETIEQFGGSEETGKKYGLPVGIALTALDLFPPTSGKAKVGVKALEEAVPQLIKEVKPSAVAKILSKVGVEKTLIEDLSKGLAKATDEGAVRELLGLGAKGAPEAKVAAKGAKQAIAEVPETTLYHTTTPGAAKAIAKEGFKDMPEADQIGQAFGKGTYFSTTPEEAEAWRQFVKGKDGKTEIVKVGGKFNIYDPKVENPADYWHKLAQKAGVKSTPELGQEIADAFLMGKESMEPDVYDDAILRAQKIIEGLKAKGIDGAKFVEPIDASEGIVNPQVVIFNTEKVNEILKGGKKPIEAVKQAAEEIKTATKPQAIKTTPKLKIGPKEAEAFLATDGRMTHISELMPKAEDLKRAFRGDVPPGNVARETAGEVADSMERRFVTRTRKLEPKTDEWLAGKYTPRSTEELAHAADNLIDSDLVKAEEMARNGFDDKSVAVASRLIDKYVTEGRTATTEAAKNALYEKAAIIANDAARNLTEHGRAIQAATLLGQLTPEGMVRFAAREIQKYNEGVTRTMGGIFGAAKKVPELTGDQAQKIVDAMKKIADIEDTGKKAEAIHELSQEIRKMVPSSIYDKVVTVWKAGLLTGLKTTGLNVLSNMSHTALEVAKDVPATIVDSIASLFTGKRTMALTLKGEPSGVKEGIAKGWRYFKTGFDERDVAGKLDLKGVNFGNSRTAKLLQGYTDTVFRILGSEDQPFYYGAKARSIASQAIAMAKNEGLKGAKQVERIKELMANPTDEIIKNATMDAEMAVFTNRTWLGDAAKAIQRIPGGQFVVPFTKTPAAVATQVFNYTPLGGVATIVKNIGKGRFNQKEFAQGIGRAITGTAALFIGGELYKKGMVTLDWPTSDKEKQQWILEGRLPNTILVDGKWRSPAALGPAGLVLVVGAHMQEALEKTGSQFGAVTTLLAGIGNTLTEQSFLKGLNQAIDAIKDPQRSFEGYAMSLVGSAVPTLIADVARSTDEYERVTRSPGERVQSRIPGARQGLEPKIDTFGNKIPTPDFWTTMIDATRPGVETIDRKDPIVKELRRLADAGYLATPTQLGPNAGYESLTPEQNTYLWQLAGKYSRKAIEDVVNHKSYGRLDDEQRAKEINTAVDDAKVEARARAILNATNNLSAEEARRKLAQMKEEKLLTNEVYAAYLSLQRRSK